MRASEDWSCSFLCSRATVSAILITKSYGSITKRCLPKIANYYCSHPPAKTRLRIKDQGSFALRDDARGAELGSESMASFCAICDNMENLMNATEIPRSGCTWSQIHELSIWIATAKFADRATEGRLGGWERGRNASICIVFVDLLLLEIELLPPLYVPFAMAWHEMPGIIRRTTHYM